MSDFGLVEFYLLPLIIFFSQTTESIQLQNNFSIIDDPKVLPNIQTNPKIQLELKNRKKKSFVLDHVHTCDDTESLNYESKSMVESFFQSPNGVSIRENGNPRKNVTLQEDVNSSIKGKSKVENHDYESDHNSTEHTGKLTTLLFPNKGTGRSDDHVIYELRSEKRNPNRKMAMALPKEKKLLINNRFLSPKYKRRTPFDYKPLTCNRRYTNGKSNYLKCDFGANNSIEAGSEAGGKDPMKVAESNFWKSEVNWIKKRPHDFSHEWRQKILTEDNRFLPSYRAHKPVNCRCPAGSKCCSISSRLQSARLDPFKSSVSDKRIPNEEGMTTQGAEEVVNCGCGCPSVVESIQPAVDSSLSKH